MHGTELTAETNRMIMLAHLFSAIYQNEGWQRDRSMVVDLDLARFKQYVWQRIVACQESGSVFLQFAGRKKLGEHSKKEKQNYYYTNI